MRRDDFLDMISADGWSNSACMGYVIHACRTLDLSDPDIAALLTALKSAFTNITAAEAEQIYRDF